MSGKKRLLGFLVVGILLWSTLNSWAQGRFRQPPDWGSQEHIEPQYLTQKNTAILPKHPRADDLVMVLERAEQVKDWSKFIEACQAAEKGYPNQVVPISEELYLGVEEFVAMKLKNLPKEGKLACQGLCDPLAKPLFEEAQQKQDVILLEHLAVRYSLSSYANFAHELLTNLHLERGEVDKAAEVFKALMGGESVKPSLSTFARVAVALSLAGEKDRLQKLRETIEKQYPTEMIVLGERRVGLKEYVRELEKKTQAPPKRVGSMQDWLHYGNYHSSPCEARLELEKLPPKLWEYTVSRPAYDYLGSYLYGWDGGVPHRSPPESRYRPIFPSVWDGKIFFHTENHFYALELAPDLPDKQLESSKPKILWELPVEGPGVHILFDDRNIHTTTVYRGKVFGNVVTAVGETERSKESEAFGIVTKYPFPKRKLLALDAHSGRLVWEIGGKKDWKENDALLTQLEKGASFSTAPTPDGDYVYAGCTLQYDMSNPFKHYVVCVDAESGKIKWATFVCSNVTELSYLGNPTREALGSPVTMAGDNLFYSTNAGVLVCLDKKSGRIRWIHTYQQLPIRAPRSSYIPTRNPLEWVSVPPLVAEGLVLVTPTDSHYLYAIEVATGQQKWFIERESSVRYIYGVHDSVLVLGGDELYFYDIKKDGKRLAKFSPEQGSGAGRGVVVGDVVYFPTTQGLYRISVETQKPLGFESWPGNGAHGGNLVLVDKMVMVTDGKNSDDVLTVYYERSKEVQRAKKSLR